MITDVSDVRRWPPGTTCALRRLRNGYLVVSSMQVKHSSRERQSAFVKMVQPVPVIDVEVRIDGLWCVDQGLSVHIAVNIADTHEGVMPLLFHRPQHERPAPSEKKDDLVVRLDRIWRDAKPLTAIHKQASYIATCQVPPGPSKRLIPSSALQCIVA